jgi:hypothetical protein
MNRWKKVLIVLIFVCISVAVVIGGSFNLFETSPGGPPVIAVTKSTCDRPPGFILIIADLSGFNDSIGHGAPLHPWPVIHVHQGDAVQLLVCNRDTTQPHGFAIGTYLNAGMVLAPGDAYRVVFTATVPGTFVIYCNIFCTVHVFMRSQLIVSE